MSIAVFKEWSQISSNNLSDSNAAIFQTKYTDFDNPYGKKSIYNVTINVSESSGSANSAILVQVFYRTTLKEGFALYASKAFTGESGYIEDRIVFNKKLYGIKGVQFSFRIQCFSSNFGINDINIAYREHRESSSSNLSSD
jgi:hypothetical protein